MWTLRHGKNYEWYLDIEASGGHISALDTKPELYEDLRQDFKAFGELHQSRRYTGFGPSPLCVTDILAYMEMFDICDYEARKIFLKRIQVMDQAYLQYSIEQTAKTSSADNNKANK